MKEHRSTTIAQLSKREQQILQCVSQGLSSKEIADKLFLSKNTVDTHRRNILRKRDVKRCTSLIEKEYAGVIGWQ